MDVRRYAFSALVFPAIMAVGPSLPPPSRTEPPKLEAPAEPEVHPPEEPCDDEEGGLRSEA